MSVRQRWWEKKRATTGELKDCARRGFRDALVYVWDAPRGAV